MSCERDIIQQSIRRENESTKRKVEEKEEEEENVLSCLQFASDPVSADRKWSLASERVCTLRFLCGGSNARMVDDLGSAY